MTVQTLKSLLLESKDGEWGKAEPFEDSVKMTVVRGTDFDKVGHGKLDGLPVRYVPLRIAKRKTLQPNDILLETAGGSKNRPTGRTLFLKPSHIWRSELPLTCASFSRFIRVDPQKVEPHYLYWHLQYLYEFGYLHKYHTQHTGVARFQYTVFAENEELHLPPLLIQRKIASVLSAYDDLIENNTRRIEILEEMAQAIYREWFVNFRFPGHEKVGMVDSPLGKIPEGWEVKKLGDVIELAYGKALKKDNRVPGSIPVYGSGGVVGYHSESLVDGPGIVVGRKGNVGSVYWSDYDFFPIDTVFYVQTEVSLHYIFYSLQDQNFINNDAAVPGLNRNQAYSLSSSLLPDLGTLEQFQELVDPMFQHVKIMKEKNASLRHTRDLLLPKLISGEVDVGELDIDSEVTQRSRT